MTRARQRLLAVVAALGGAVLLAYAVRRAGADEIAESIQRLGWGVVAILGLAGARLCLRACAWRLCTPPQARLSVSRAIGAFIAGDAVGNLTPLGMAASEPTKAFLVRHRLATNESIASLAIDNLVYAASIATMVVAGLVVALAIVPLPIEGRDVAIAVLVALVIGAAVTMRLLRGTWSPEGGPRPPWRESVSRVRQSVVAFWSDSPVRVAQAFACDMAFHVLAVYEIFLTLGWLFGERPTLVQAFVFEVLNRAVTVAFKFIPFRVGVDEALNGALAPVMGLHPAAGVTLALIRKARNLAWTGVGLLLIAGAPARVAPGPDRQGSAPARRT
jgi:Lysylphosphatidylglycerol synthase TM region